VSGVWQVALGVLAGLLVAWLALLVALLVGRTGGTTLTEALRLLPDLLRLVARLARDRTLPRSVRVRLGLLVAYLAFPLDLIPDVIPVLGYADDVIVVVWVLRSVLRVAGEGPIRAHWPGTPEGCEAVLRIVRSRRRGDGTTRAADRAR
jgi:uncharacterized membrane protein YkvA (DUF1232 family)